MTMLLNIFPESGCSKWSGGFNSPDTSWAGGFDSADTSWSGGQCSEDANKFAYRPFSDPFFRFISWYL